MNLTPFFLAVHCEERNGNRRQDGQDPDQPKGSFPAQGRSARSFTHDPDVEEPGKQYDDRESSDKAVGDGPADPAGRVERFRDHGAAFGQGPGDDEVDHGCADNLALHQFVDPTGQGRVLLLFFPAWLPCVFRMVERLIARRQGPGHCLTGYGFVSRREMPDEKWGTPQPIIVKNPGMGLGVALLKGFGTYGYQISEPQQFVTQLVGAQGVFRTADIEERLRHILLNNLTDLLGETAKDNDVTNLVGMLSEISAAVRAKASDQLKLWVWN